MKKHLILLVLFLILIIVVLVTPLVLSNTGIVSIKDFSNLISIVFSWPSVILFISVVFIIRFYKSIESFLENIGSMKLPGGIEIQKQDQVVPKNVSDLKIMDLVKPIRKEGKPDNTNDEKKLNEKQQTELMNSVKYWRYSYLNLFFVQQTKDVLVWFSQSVPQTKQSYEVIWSPSIPDQNQRNIIFNVLIQYGMLTEDAELFTISDDGLDFLQHFNYLKIPLPTKKS